MSTNSNGTPGQSAGGFPVPDDEIMSPAEFKMTREFLGLTLEWVAAGLDVTARTVRNWEQGRYLIPDGVRLQMEAWEVATGQAVGQCVDAAMDAPDPVLLVDREDGDEPGAWPARWHRHVAARAAIELTGARVEYRPARDA